MKSALRLVATFFIFVITSIAWAVLGGVMMNRTSNQSSELRGKVAELWGEPQTQAAPKLEFRWTTERQATRKETSGGVERTIVERVEDKHKKDVSLAGTKVSVDLRLDQRLKGLTWYSLYDVGFRGEWSYVHREGMAGTLDIDFRFPNQRGIYDGFQLLIDGKEQRLTPKNGALEQSIYVEPNQKVTIVVVYKSRGLDEWRYQPDHNVAALEDFQATITTDFSDIDYPSSTLSPSTRVRKAGGWDLGWSFKSVVTGHGIGMKTPQRIQPGQLASSLSFSAPISLGFFFLLLMVLSKLRGHDVHPVNYLFLGAAFFAFHLLFAYTVDHLHIVPAFALSSGVSVLLVVSYLRLVVSPRFAFVEAGLAQLVYLVGFSLAHFFDGFTGLTVTVLSIVTLFLLMQLTGRIRWGAEPPKAPSDKPSPNTPPPPAPPGTPMFDPPAPLPAAGP